MWCILGEFLLCIVSTSCYCYISLIIHFLAINFLFKKIHIYLYSAEFNVRGICDVFWRNFCFIVSPLCYYHIFLILQFYLFIFFFFIYITICILQNSVLEADVLHYPVLLMVWTIVSTYHFWYFFLFFISIYLSIHLLLFIYICIYLYSPDQYWIWFIDLEYCLVLFISTCCYFILFLFRFIIPYFIYLFFHSFLLFSEKDRLATQPILYGIPIFQFTFEREKVTKRNKNVIYKSFQNFYHMSTQVLIVSWLLRKKGKK